MTRDLAKLSEALAAADVGERIRAAEQLSQLCGEASAAAVSLVRASGDPVEQVREWAVAALEELGPPHATDVESLASLLDHPTPDVGYWAATLLGRLGAKAASATPQLAAAVQGGADLPLRQRAAWAVGKIGSAAAAAGPALRQAASDADPRLARLARKALEQIGG